ncbi:alpha/beta hydrolase family protein [Neptunicella marina]|uniref:S9 family peptidase n=1 Tax=Neptunicella marina TaxID=2125989 RepID=A0A8J6IRK3_9ALTE|nr:S9 family peptidase [Neptunicella marina]MBC3765109.1 S9 family peptidase [Neptunicella marina]
MYKTLCCLLIISISQFTAASEFKWDDFAQLPIVEQPQISPDGTKIAAIYNTPDGASVIYSQFPTLDFSILAKLKLGRDRVDQVSWSGNRYIIISASYPQWLRGEFYRVSRLYAFDLETQQSRELTLRKFTKNSWYEYQTFTIVSNLKNDEDHILVSTYDDLDAGYSVFEVDLSNGKYEKIQNNEHNIHYWSADKNGVVRLGIERHKDDEKITRTIWYREKEGADLKKLYTRTLGEGITFNVIGVNDDGNKAYVLSDRETGKQSLWLFDIVSGKFEKLIYSNPDYDVENGLLNSQGELIGAYYSDDYLRKFYFDEKDSEQEKFLSKLLKSEHVYIVSRSQDKTKILFAKTEDNKPATYFYFDSTAKKAGIWVSEYPALNKRQFPHVQNFSFVTSDNVELHGYLTLPPNIKHPPLIVMPHGGPHSRDYKYFDPEIQYLATQGYAVLQVNFRGSEGFGTQFESSGYFEWGKKMQQDVYEAMDWVINSGKVSRGKACILGKSYGGYVALTASFQQPERFDCIISVSGISDLQELVEDDDNQGMYTGHIVNVSDEKAVKALADVSAINHINQIKSPILLIHGNKDTRVHYEQSEDFYDKAKRNKNIQYIEVENGTHFFDEQKSKQLYFEEVTKFLDTYLH